MPCLLICHSNAVKLASHQLYHDQPQTTQDVMI